MARIVCVECWKHFTDLALCVIVGLPDWFSSFLSLCAMLANPINSWLKFYTSHRDLRVVLIVQFKIRHERQFRCFPQISNYNCIAIFFFFPVMLFFLLIYPPPVGLFLHGFGVGWCHRLLFFWIPSENLIKNCCGHGLLVLNPMKKTLAAFVFSICQMTDLLLTSLIVNLFTANYNNKRVMQSTMQSKTIMCSWKHCDTLCLLTPPL